jgi:hypothetical protein
MEKLVILGLEGSAARVSVEAQFNPKEIGIDKLIPWQPQRGKGPSDLEYTRSGGRTMACELLFDGFPSSTSIQNQIDKLNRLSDPDPGLKRPPKVAVVWGGEAAGQFMPRFEAVIESLSIRYTLFAEDGKPLRAVVNLGLREAKDLAVGRKAPAGRRR